MTLWIIVPPHPQELIDELIMILSIHMSPQEDASLIQHLIPVAKRGGVERNKNVVLLLNEKSVSRKPVYHLY